METEELEHIFILEVCPFVEKFMCLKQSAVSEGISSFTYIQRNTTIIREMLLVWSGDENPRLSGVLSQTPTSSAGALSVLALVT